MVRFYTLVQVVPSDAVTGEVGTRSRGEQKTKNGVQGYSPRSQTEKSNWKVAGWKKLGPSGSKTRANWPRF